jgi:hypothetical protein
VPVQVLRKGLIVRNHKIDKKGVVIDWGTRESKYREYTLRYKEEADAVRVWTSDKIEIWPLEDLMPEELVSA